MNVIDSIGYLASILVLLTFCMGTMLRLRVVAICSNVAFVAYGSIAGIHPVLILHLILLPVNLTLLARMTTVVREAKFAAGTDLSPGWLQPFMHAKSLKAGDVVFRKNDFADCLYMIVSGEVELPEISHRLSAGELFGEIGLFSLDRRRTQTALAATDLDLLWISGNEVEKLCERNPGLSLYFLRLTATRTTTNALRAERMASSNL